MSDIVSKYIECYVYRHEEGTIKYLLLKRSPEKQPYPGIWQIVTGRIEKGEKAFETAGREVFEETGIEASSIYVLPEIGGFYTAHTDCLHLIPLFIAESDTDVVKMSEEHTEFGWFGFGEARKKIHWMNQKRHLDTINEMLTDINLKKTLVEIKNNSI